MRRLAPGTASLRSTRVAGDAARGIVGYIACNSGVRDAQSAPCRAGEGRGAISGLQPTCKGSLMKVSDILRVKGGTLFTVSPDDPLIEAVNTMSANDIGSLVVMEHGELAGMLTFREVIQAVVDNGGSVGASIVRSVMDDAPLTCTPDTEIDEVRRMMLGRHARYMPVMTQRTLMGVISFYDVAKAVVDGQDFENRMLKAYIRDWPVEAEPPGDTRSG